MRNVYPNKYKVFYEDYKGRKNSEIIEALTGYEAMNRLRSKNLSFKNVSFKPIKRKYGWK